MILSDSLLLKQLALLVLCLFAVGLLAVVSPVWMLSLTLYESVLFLFRSTGEAGMGYLTFSTNFPSPSFKRDAPKRAASFRLK